MNLYVVKDIKAGRVGGIVEFINDDVAQRAIEEARNNKESDIGRWPTDFELWKVGEKNEKTGEITPELRCME